MSSRPPVETWRVAIELLKECPTAMAETREFWAEIASRFDDPLDRTDTPAQLKSDFLTAQARQDEFVRRATTNVGVLGKVLEESQRTIETALKLSEASNISAEDLILKTLSAPIQDLPALIQDTHLLGDEAPAILVNASSTIIAVTAPWIFIRDAFAIYLDKPTLGANAFAVFVTLVKEGGMHLAGEAIPFIGPIIALAEALKEQEEKGYKDFTTFVEQSVKHLSLTKAVDQGLQHLNASDQAIRDYTQSIATTNGPFLERAARVAAFLKTDSAASA